MHSTPIPVDMRISEFSLQLIAVILGFAGTASVIVQAWLWIPSAHANRAVLILTACVPVIAAIVFTLVPRRIQDNRDHGYALHAPMVWITIGLPLLITVLSMVLIGESGNFNNFAGLALTLAANAGRNAQDFVRALILRRVHRHLS
jgi:hypothetical protein